jgi:hypothetical protein
MSFVGSLSASISSPTIGVTGSLIPGTTGFSLGTSTNKWQVVDAQYVTGTIKMVDAAHQFLAAGTGITLNYNDLGQWEVTGTASATAAGADTQVQFNDGGTAFGASANLTFNKTTNVLSTVNANVTTVSASNIVPHATQIFVGGQGKVAPGSFGTDSLVFISGSDADRMIVGGTLVLSGDVYAKNSSHQNTVQIIAANGSISGSGNLSTAGDLAVQGNAIITGNLTVNGTTVTENVDNMTIEDPIIGLGFTNVGTGSAGDRGFIGGIIGGQNVAFAWSDGNSSFIHARTLTNPDSAGPISISSYLPARASSFQVNGTSAYVSSSNGSNLDLMSAARLRLSGSTSVQVTGSMYIGATLSDTVTFNSFVASNFTPQTDVTYDLGASDKRWRNIYTGDLHLRNERGDYTLIEEADFLSIRFNKTGKRYKFLLERVPELDE